MNHRLIAFCFLIFLLPAGAATARTGGISGRVIDEGGKPVVFASVLLQRTTDSSLISSALSNDKGEYELTPVAGGNYLLKVVMMGYETAIVSLPTIGTDIVATPNITLVQNTSGLSEVMVSVQKPFIEVHPDKLVVNVENSIVSTGSSVMDVLARSPGVTIDNNDNISLKGKQGVTIMIDGRIVPVSAADLANMLKSMPSASVDKIEIITNPSARYDAAGTAGIINIKTKKDNKTGLNGSVNTSYAQGVYPKEYAGINLSYREKKLSVYASYNANYREGFSKVNWIRDYFTNNIFSGAYVQQNYTTLQFHTNIFSAGVDYSITSKTSVGMALTGENFYLGTKGYYFANVLDQNSQLQSYFATNNTSGGNWNNYAPNVHLKHTFDTSGKELTVDADYASYWNRNHQDFLTRYLLTNGAEYQPDYILHGDISGLTQIRSLKADYVNPLRNNARLEAGFKTSYVTEDNEPNFYNVSTGVPVWDPTNSDHFIYNENINALYVNASKDWTKWSTQFGVRAEQTIVNGDEKITGQTFQNSYVQLFPDFALQDHVNKNNDVRLSLSRRIERPGYDDLNPYTFFVDPSTQKTGNPYLLPALTYAAELSHTFRQRFTTSLSYSTTSNVITEVIKPSTTQDHVTIQTKDNLAAMNYAGVSGAYTFPIAKWWTNVTNFDAFYARYIGNLSNTDLNAGKAAFDVNTINKFTLPKEYSAEVSVFYQSAQVYGFLNLSAISMFNVGIQKNCFNKKLTLKLSANDIFWHGNENGSSYFNGYTEVFTAKHDTRQVAISVTYRFGKNTVPQVRKHSGGAEDEKKRASENGA